MSGISIIRQPERIERGAERGKIERKNEILFLLDGYSIFYTLSLSFFLSLIPVKHYVNARSREETVISSLSQFCFSSTLRWKRNSSRFKKKNGRLILNSISSPYNKITILKFWILEIFKFLLNAPYESYSEKGITNSQFGANYKCGSNLVEHYESQRLMACDLAEKGMPKDARYRAR